MIFFFCEVDGKRLTQVEEREQNVKRKFFEKQ